VPHKIILGFSRELKEMDFLGLDIVMNHSIVKPNFLSPLK
jgi:hypothetical protein